MSGRGQLRVYLGAAPGVGKTFAMLDEGRRRIDRGTDVVVAYVETHRRPHTEEKLDGLEVVPRRILRELRWLALASHQPARARGHWWFSRAASAAP